MLSTIWIGRGSGPKKRRCSPVMISANAMNKMNCACWGRSMKALMISLLQQVSHCEQQQGGNRRQRPGRQSGRRPHRIAGIHADDDHFAVGEIDEAHDAEDDGQAERDERIDYADQDPADDIEIEAGHVSGSRRRCHRLSNGTSGNTGLGLGRVLRADDNGFAILVLQHGAADIGILALFVETGSGRR